MVSIYLRRGLASGEIVYGLSDIDFLVLLDDEHVQNKEKVGRIYDRLSGFIPLFSDKENELGVHSISEFLNLYRDHNSYRFRFDEGKHQWRLLSGKDFVKTLNPLEETELDFLATEELKVWWAFLTAEINPDPSVPRFKRKYLWYKAIAEAAKIYISVCHRRKVYRRATALKEVREYLPAEFQSNLQDIAGYIKNLTGHRPILVDESIQLFIWLATRSYDKMELVLPAGHARILATASIPPLDKKTSEGNLQNRVSEPPPISKDLEPYIERIAIIPQVEFDVDVLNNSDIDSFYLAIIQKRALPMSAINKLVSTLHLNLTSGKVEPFLISEGKLALALSAARPQTGIKSSKSDPLFFSLLENNSTVHCNLPGNFEKTLYTRLARINAVISNNEIYKARYLDFCRLFWSATRTKLLINALFKPEVSIPINARQIADHLCGAFPEKSEWFNNLYAEYARELTGQESEIHLFFTDAINFLYCIDKRGSEYR